MTTVSKKLLLATSILLCGAAHAADVRVAESARGKPLRAIMIEGEIKSGDYLKFVNTFLDNPERNYDVLLYSPGGDFSESLKIGRLIHALKLTTQAPVKTGVSLHRLNDATNKVCASSCFFIFAAGAQRFGDIVGIHRPYLPKKAYRKFSMGQAGQAHSIVRRMVDAYLVEIDVPTSYVDRIMAVDSGDVEWLSQEELKKHFHDFAPAYREWVEAKCRKPSDANGDRMVRILKATPAQYANLPVQDVPYKQADKEFLDKHLAQEEKYYDCRASIQRKEIDRIWTEMLGRKLHKEAQLRREKR